MDTKSASAVFALPLPPRGRLLLRSPPEARLACPRLVTGFRAANLSRMTKTPLFAAAIALLALPAFAQTTTTVTTDTPPPQVAPPPPPPPSTQVVVNPQSNQPPAVIPPADPPPPVVVQQDPVVVHDDTVGVETRPQGRSAVKIIAVDALYGGVAGGLVGGGVTLIDQGNNWARDVMVGAGIGVLVGAAYGVFESATQPTTTTRAIADRNPAASDSIGVAPAQYAARF
jgi:hypothetical protein